MYSSASSDDEDEPEQEDEDEPEVLVVEQYVQRVLVSTIAIFRSLESLILLMYVSHIKAFQILDN